MDVDANNVLLDELKVALIAILPWALMWHAMYRAFQVMS
jgi:hypothetical protein